MPRPIPLLVALLVAVLVASSPLIVPQAIAQAQPAPFANGDAVAGKALADKDCVACHARRFDGNADRIYTRDDRRVTTPAQLLAQISYCNTQLGTNYFPDEEEHIAAYLNKQYYRFH